MEDKQHQERLKQIETEIFEIRREMSQFEFKAKKEEVERKKEIDKLRKESEVRRAQGEKSNEAIRNHLKHLSTLAGITFEQLDEMDFRLESASVSLARKNKT